MKTFKEMAKEKLEILDEGVTFKGMEKKCYALQDKLDKFNDSLLDFQEIEDDRPKVTQYTRKLYKTFDAFKKDLEILKTFLRKTN